MSKRNISPNQSVVKKQKVADFFNRPHPLTYTTKEHGDVVKKEKGDVVKEEGTEKGEKKLNGTTIVFSGNMGIDRERAMDLAVAAGAKVTSAVSSKTTFLVIGSVLEDGRAVEEGSKYKKMVQLRAEKKSAPQLLTESEFLNKIGISSSVPQREAFTPLVTSTYQGQGGNHSTSLWVDKYAPQTLNQFVGNSSTVSKLMEWLKKWKSSSPPSGGYRPSNFPGKGGNTDAKAALLSGPPGIGKSLLAKLACESCGFQLIEFNASDYRSKSSVDLINSVLSHSSFTFSSTSTARLHDQQLHLAKQCLVMDEVDGMSAGDRGGNQALMKMVKETSIPIICICNDRMNAKVRSLANHCFDLKMNRPTKIEVVNRAKQILASEKTSSVPDSVIDQVVQGADCDLRQVINQLQGDSFNWASTIASFEKKDRSTMLTPFEACRSILAPPPSMTLNERLDMFFVDYDFIPLLVQQNYLKCFQPKDVSLIQKSASLISFGDLISRAIRAEQNWSLLPEFGLIGNVFVPPKLDPGFSPFPEFPVWLGKNSTTRKSARIAHELQCVVSIASSVTARNIVISNYAHVLFVHFVHELIRAMQSSGNQPALPTLDLLGVSKNDLIELLTELLLPWQPDVFSEKLDAKSKAAITRICNAHHAALKSGGAHFRRLKSAGDGPSLSLSLGDERGDKLKSDSVSDDEVEVKTEKKNTDLLVKAAKPPSKKPTAKKATRKA